MKISETTLRKTYCNNQNMYITYIVGTSVHDL